MAGIKVVSRCLWIIRCEFQRHSVTVCFSAGTLVTIQMYILIYIDSQNAQHSSAPFGGSNAILNLILERCSTSPYDTESTRTSNEYGASGPRLLRSCRRACLCCEAAPEGLLWLFTSVAKAVRAGPWLLTPETQNIWWRHLRPGISLLSMHLLCDIEVFAIEYTALRIWPVGNSWLQGSAHRNFWR